MEEIQILNKAFNTYNLNNEPDLSNKILNYILERILDNEPNIRQMADVTKEGVTFEEILNAFNDAYREEEYYKKQDSFSQGQDYYCGRFPVPIGNIVVETNNVLKVIKYFVGGIKSRNTITISQTEYLENSLSNMMLIIFKEAVSKFNLDNNIFNILPYEDCFYDHYDEVIEIENDEETLKQRPFSNKYIVYDNDGIFKEEVEEEKERLKDFGFDFEYINCSLDEAVEHINKIRPMGAAIYTESSNSAYNFVNMVHTPNAFVNSSLLNQEELPDKKNKLYYLKTIMYPSGKDFDLKEYLKEYEE